MGKICKICGGHSDVHDWCGACTADADAKHAPDENAFWEGANWAATLARGAFLKTALRGTVFQMLNNTAEGDDEHARYSDLETDEIVRNMWDFGDALDEKLRELIDPNLTALIEEWKLTQKAIPKTPAGRLQMIGDLVSPQVVDGEVVAPIITQDEAKKLGKIPAPQGLTDEEVKQFMAQDEAIGPTVKFTELNPGTGRAIVVATAGPTGPVQALFLARGQWTCRECGQQVRPAPPSKK